ncbi:MAG: ABC transporter permease [Candidatus Eremiobacteraeota bacterium]|nr:ABC transporter permease [Candidatus Eremiobacteraeota bacterium]
MNVMATLRLAATALLRNRVRSLLTMLGIIIGVAAVIVTVAIGMGARNAVKQQIDALGSNLLIVLPGSLNQGGVRTGNGGASTLTVGDGMAIARLPGVAAVSPSANVRAQVVAGGNNWQTTVTGVAPTYQFIRSWSIASGSFFTDADVASAAKVAVLGQTVVSNLFPDGASPVGQTVLIRNVPFTVVGTLTSKGQSGVGQDQDDTVLIPYTAALERMTGSTTLGSLMVSASDPNATDTVQNEITSLLEQRHRIVTGQTDDFQVRNLADIAATASQTASIFAYLLAAIASISLLVGGIGIMNIMLVSVTERTREIGLRMAVGARNAVILRQFLLEAIMLATTGGAIGALLGAIGGEAIGKIAGWGTAITPTSIALAIGFSAAVGVFFGYAPAQRAAQLNPIEALRFE